MEKFGEKKAALLNDSQWRKYPRSATSKDIRHPGGHQHVKGSK
jgi:hypothetical protein